jgi:hypothetical protein
MANSFDSNITRKLARVFLEKFESARVLSKNVNTQLLSGKFNPSSGAYVDFKRPVDYTTTRTSAGDISGSSPDDITTGKATGTVQNYFTTWVDFTEADEAIKMDQIDQLLAPMATRIVTDLELDFASYMMKNSGLYAGTIGTGADAWSDVAEASAVMKSHGVPQDDMWCYAVNPYTEVALAAAQRSLGAGGSAGDLVSEAHRKAILSDDFAGMRVMSATTLPSYTTHSGADRVGAIDTGGIDVTYATAKDTMTQTISVTGFQANLQVRAGDILQIAGRYHLNKNTREVILDEAGNKKLFTGVVTTAVTLDGSGEGDITIAGPAIYESGGAYNTVDSAPVATDVVTLLGAASTTYQPNLFWHKQAFSMGFVPMKKLYSTDTLATTEDGVQMRVSKYADGDKNIQTVRFDIRPAYATLNPFFAGHGYGT